MSSNLKKNRNRNNKGQKETSKNYHTNVDIHNRRTREVSDGMTSDVDEPDKDSRRR